MLLVPCFLLASSWFALAYDHSLARLIRDVVGPLVPAVTVSAYFCRLDEDDALVVSNSLSSYGLIHEIRSNPERFSPIVPEYLDHRRLFVLDLDCDYAISLLRTANASGMFGAPARWLLIRNRTRLLDVADSTENRRFYDDAAETFKRMAVYPDSEVILATVLRKNFAEITSIYRISRYNDVTVENRGNWTLENGVRAKDFLPTSRRRANLQQTRLKTFIVVTNPDTVNHLTDFKYRHIDGITKANYAWLTHIVNRMNVSIDISVTDTWGYQSENGSWNGLVNLLERGEADIGGTGMFLIKPRIGHVHYVQLYTSSKLSIATRFIFRQPSLSTVSNIFALPFRGSVWLAILAFLTLVLFMLYVSFEWEYRRGTSTSESAIAHRQRTDPMHQTLADNLMMVLAAAGQQGYTYEPYRVPSRIITLMLLFASLSLYTSYTAKIVALLQSTTDSIKTLPDLLNSPLKCGVYDVIYNRYYFKNFSDPVRQALVAQKIEQRGNNYSWMSMEEGVRRIRNELFAFHGETGPVYDLMQHTYQEEDKCGLTEIDMLKFIDPLFTIPRGSPYKEIMTNSALLLKEVGLTYREDNRLYGSKPKCLDPSKFISIGFTECYFAFLAIGYGMLLSLIVLAGEFFWYRRRAWSKNGDEASNRRPTIDRDYHPETLFVQRFGIIGKPVNLQPETDDRFSPDAR